MTIRTAIKPLGAGKIKFDTTPVRFDYTGETQTYQVPLGCKKLYVDCVGGTHSGRGGRVQCVLSVKSKQQLYIIVAQADANGYNASDIRTIENDLSSRLVVAGGGGEAGKQGNITVGANGGNLSGGTANNASKNAQGGQGGTQTSGGAGGVGSGGESRASGAMGVFGLGGVGGGKGGHGGSGWYGGGGGAWLMTQHFNNKTYYSSGGGGGSSYTHPELCTFVEHTQGFNPSGNGYVIITPMEK